SEPFQGTEGQFYWLSGLRRSCFMVNQTITAKASYQKANKIRSYGVIFYAVGISALNAFKQGFGRIGGCIDAMGFKISHGTKS
ncbi:MAG: hypothetical protein OIF56_02885, partial [Cohaesibacter sp.]|nr:hypothetical protein [Cohaesibacter sp.]